MALPDFSKKRGVLFEDIPNKESQCDEPEVYIKDEQKDTPKDENTQIIRDTPKEQKNMEYTLEQTQKLIKNSELLYEEIYGKKSRVSIGYQHKQILFMGVEHFDCNIKQFSTSTRLGASDLRAIAQQLIEGLASAHKLNICHRDLKPQNLLVNSRDLKTCIADWGSAKEFTEHKTGGISYICSRPYRAPELMFGRTDYTLASDVWSLGCVLFEVANKWVLFSGLSNKECLRKMVNYLGKPSKGDLLGMNEKRNIELTFQPKNWRLSKKFKGYVPKEYVKLVEACLKWNPKERLNLEDALQREFFKN